jgi:hypothetical protein
LKQTAISLPVQDSAERAAMPVAEISGSRFAAVGKYASSAAGFPRLQAAGWQVILLHPQPIKIAPDQWQTTI